MTSLPDSAPVQYPILLTPDSDRQINLTPRVLLTDFVRKEACPTLTRHVNHPKKLFFLREYHDQYGQLSDCIVSVYLPHLSKNRRDYHRVFLERATQMYKTIFCLKKVLKSISGIRLDRKMTKNISEAMSIIRQADECRMLLEHAYSIKAHRIGIARVLLFSATHIRY